MGRRQGRPRRVYRRRPAPTRCRYVWQRKSPRRLTGRRQCRGV